jgi:hypothetical protein
MSNRIIWVVHTIHFSGLKRLFQKIDQFACTLDNHVGCHGMETVWDWFNTTADLRVTPKSAIQYYLKPTFETNTQNLMSVI